MLGRGGRGQRGGAALARGRDRGSPARGRRLSHGKPRAFRRVLAEASRRDGGSPSRRARAAAQVAGGARRAQLARRDSPQRRDALIGGGGAGSGAARPARSGRLLPLPGRNGASVPREARGRPEGGAAGGAWGAVV